jgi:Spy/CpxP family protein refolding chaperone
MFIAMSLDTLNTTPEQAGQITKIQNELHAKMAPAKEAEKNVIVTIADGVAAGKVTPAKVDAAIAKLSTAAAGVHDAVADSLNQLHAVLNPSQRAALVDKVEAHFEVWHEANAAEEPKERDEHGGHLGRLTKDLSLTPDQVEKIRGQFTSTIGSAPAKFDRAEADAHLKAWGEAFASETFDAKSISTGGPANAHIATWGATRMAHFYEAVAPVLTKEQRGKLAEQLRKHANFKPNSNAS